MMKRVIPIVLSMVMMLMSSCSTEQTISKETVSTMEDSIKSVEATAEEAEEIAVGIDPNFKAAMDSYEAFFDEYVDFMEQYMESDDISNLATAYSDYMVKYIDTMEKIEAIDENELTAEEALYYAEVTARISQKLIDVME